MALGQKVRLDLEDGTSVEATYDGRDIRRWESTYGKSALGVPMTLSMLTYFGWSAAKREHSLNGEYDRYEAFDAVCVSVTGVRDEVDEELDPTEPATDTQSSPSDD